MGLGSSLELSIMEASYASSLIFFYIYAQYLIVNILAISANHKSSHHSQPFTSPSAIFPFISPTPHLQTEALCTSVPGHFLDGLGLVEDQFPVEDGVVEKGEDEANVGEVLGDVE